jgi:circadian clock protein KaiB
MAAKKAANKPTKAPKNGNGHAHASHDVDGYNDSATWNLWLYVAGDSPRSRTALNNLRKLCEERLKGNYNIEVIDLTKRPDLAKVDQILAVPTLIRKIPEPMKRIIGDLSNADRALVALDMHTLSGETA